MPETPRRECEVVLERGLTVLLCTDGLVERRGQSLEVELGRLRAVLGELDAHDLGVDALADAVLEALLPGRAEDDVAMVAVRLYPQDRPRPPETGPRRLPSNVDDVPEALDELTPLDDQQIEYLAEPLPLNNDDVLMPAPDPALFPTYDGDQGPGAPSTAAGSATTAAKTVVGKVKDALT